MVPLAYKLKNGDTIEIITSNNQKPSKDWLKTVTTSRARTKIRQWLRLNEREDDVRAGREACEREFKKYNLNFSRLLKSGKIGKVAEELGVHSVPDLLTAVAQGKKQVSHIVQKILPPEELDIKLKTFREKIAKRLPTTKDYASGIQVKGLDQILVNFARCCSPLPGDNIIGYITKGRGVTIHLEDCPRLLEMDKERRIEVSWKLDSQVTRPAKIKVLSQDKPGLLSEISGTITKLKSNIRNATITTTSDRRGMSTFEVDIKDSSHLNTIIQNIQKLKGVIAVSRVKL